MKLRYLIKETTRLHLENSGIVATQNLGGVGALNGTFPEDLVTHDGVWELPTSDCSNAGVLVGASLFKSVMYVIRFGGFTWLNGSYLANYAAIAEGMWGTHCNIFVRSMASEGNIGPVASHMNHSMIMHMPGIRIHAPMIPWEWNNAWNDNVFGNQPIYCSEHRSSYDLEDGDLIDQWNRRPSVSIFAIGAARLRAKEAAAQLSKDSIVVDVNHVHWLKPFDISIGQACSIERSGRVLVVDSDRQICGATEHIGICLLEMYPNIKLKVMGVADKVCGFNNGDVMTPSVKDICNAVRSMI